VASPRMGLGQLKSAIWTVGFKASLDEKKMNALSGQTQKAAGTISRQIQKQILANHKAP